MNVSAEIKLLLPFVLFLARIAAFIGSGPIFSWRFLPMRIRVGLTLVITIFLTNILPAPSVADYNNWLGICLLLLGEILFGLTMGMAITFVFTAVELAGKIIGRQMGLALAAIVDPATGQRNQPIGIILQTVFVLLFLAAGGHHMLLTFLAKSYEVFPVGQTPNIAVATGVIIDAGSVMLTFALKLAAPVLGAFMILLVVLGIMARVLPEMNILFLSLPMRVALGLFMAAAITPSLNSFIDEFAYWMNRMFVG